MILLLSGLVLFLGAHSARFLFDGVRSRVIAARGENAWKGIVGGTVIRAVFVFRAHRALIGVSPLGI